MILEQASNKRLITKDIRSLLSLAIEIYSEFFIREDCHLTKREKEFFIGCIFAFRENIGLSGRKFTNYMMNKYKFSDSMRAIYTMRDTIKNKKWIIQTSFGYDIPSLFKQDLNNFRVNLEVLSNGGSYREENQERNY